MNIPAKWRVVMLDATGKPMGAFKEIDANQVTVKGNTVIVYKPYLFVCPTDKELERQVNACISSFSFPGGRCLVFS